MYILKTIYIKIREWIHCGPCPSVVVLTGLISVCTRLNVIVMYTWNTSESSWIWIWMAYRIRLKITQNLRILTFFRLRFFETCAAMQSVFTCLAVTNINWWNCPWKVDSTFLFLPLLGQEKQSNVKLKPSIHKYPTPSIWPKYHLWMPILKRTGLCIQVLVAICILVTFYAFNVIDSNKHNLWHTFTRTYS